MTSSRTLIVAVLAPLTFLLRCVAAYADSGIQHTPFEIPDGAYSANYVKTVNDIAVIEFSGDYNKSLPNGDANAAARAVVAKEFYQKNGDNFDFLVIFSEFEFDSGDARAFHLGVSNDIEGIGIPVFSNAEQFGSEGKLKGYIDMTALQNYQTNSLVADAIDERGSFETGINILAHEVLHQWAAFPEIPELQGRDNAHWNFFLNTDGSVEYGHRWRDNGDGTFTAVGAREKYSQLDLYLMGLLSKDEVPPFFVIEPENDVKYSPTDLPAKGITVRGTRKNFTVDDLIASQGERHPSVENSQKEFKFAFIYLTPFGAEVSDSAFAEINSFRKEFSTRFSILANGRGVANVRPIVTTEPDFGSTEAIESQGDIEASPLATGLAFNWLLAQQNPNGAWADKVSTSIRDSALMVTTLNERNQAAAASDLGRVWLKTQAPVNADSLSRVLLAAPSQAGLEALLKLNNESDGGWGLDVSLKSNVLDTALATCAIQRTSPAEHANYVSSGVKYVVSQQKSDGGWSYNNTESKSVELTANILASLKCAGVELNKVQSSLDWLASTKNVDGGYGDTFSTVQQTANVLSAFASFQRLDSIDVGTAIDFIISRQSSDGDWGGSVYTTALVLNVLRQTSLPNIRVTSIAVKPEDVLDGQLVKVEIALENNGPESALPSVLTLFEGESKEAGVVLQSLELPELASYRKLIVSFYWSTFGKAGDASLTVVADEQGVVNEGSEQDNTATARFVVSPVAASAELTIASQELSVAPEQVSSLPSTVRLTALVRNIGMAAAPDLRVELWEGPPFVGELISFQIIDILPRSSQELSFEYLKTTPFDQELYVVVDANKRIEEENELDNTASISIGSVNSVDLSVSVDDLIVPDTAPLVNKLIELGAVIKNKGTVPVSGVPVRITVSNREGVSEVTTVNVNLSAGEETQIVAGWSVNAEGLSTVLVDIDPENQLAETNKSNNIASAEFDSILQIGKNLSINFREFSILPEVGLQGMGTTFNIAVRNSGTEQVDEVDIAFYDGNPAVGGELVARETIYNLAGSEVRNVTSVWPDIATEGSRFVYALVDSKNDVSEFNETDNQAFLEYNVISLPDLAVASESLSSDPRYPRTGVLTKQTVVVNNRGMQDAAGVVVRAYLGDKESGILLAQGLIDVSAGGAEKWLFSHEFVNVGQRSIHVVVDPDNVVRELNELNNEFSKVLDIQDGEFYLSDRFISPDNDGVLDTVEYTFNLDAAQKASVVVINKYSEEVYEYSFDEAVISERVSWDGKNRFGSIVADGTYSFAVKDQRGSYLGHRTVVLDVNRSPLSEAFDTAFALERNLTCRIGEVQELNRLSLLDSLIYSTDNQFLYFNSQFEPYLDEQGNEVNTDALHPYPTGLYQSAIDGSEVKQLLAPENYEPTMRRVESITPSYDGERLLLKVLRSGDYFDYLSMDLTGEATRTLATPSQIELDQGLNFVSEPIPLPNDQYLYWYSDQQCCQSAFKQLYITQDKETPTKRVVFDVSDVNPDFYVTEVKVNSDGSHFLARLVSRYSSPSDVTDILNSPNTSTLVLVDIAQATYSIVDDAVDAFEWSPNGDLFAIALPSEGKVNVVSKSLVVYQSVDIAGVQWTEANLANGALQTFTQDTFSSNPNPTQSLLGSVLEIAWNPDSSEFAIMLEDHLGFALSGNYCIDGGGSPEDLGVRREAGIERVVRRVTDWFVSTAQAQALDPLCAIVASSVNQGIYNPVDGVYLIKLSKQEVTQVASIAVAGVASRFDEIPHRVVGDFQTTAQVDSALDANFDGMRDLQFTANNVPVQNGVPLVYYRQPLFSVGYFGYEFLSGSEHKRMFWLDGARELLINPSEYRDNRLEEEEGVDDRPPVEVDYPVPFAPLVVDLNNPLEESRLIFADRSFEQASNGVLGVSPTTATKFLSFYSNDESDACASFDETLGYRQFQSLLNLTADLRIRRGKSQGGFLLEGSAIDKNFARYELHYRDANITDTWESLMPPSDTQVKDGRFTTWVPPYIGSFYVRLTVYDKAGNSREAVKRVINSERASISGIYLSEPSFSPNGDGVKEETTLHFKVLNTVNLLVNIYNSDNVLVRTLSDSFELIGSEEFFTWDGRNALGQTVPDDTYRIEIQNYEFFVELDTVFPSIEDISQPLFFPSLPVKGQFGEIIEDLCQDRDVIEAGTECTVSQSNSFSLRMLEKNTDQIAIEVSPRGKENWHLVDESLISTKLFDQNSSSVIDIPAEERLKNFRQNDYRARVVDRAGNESILVIGNNKINRAHILEATPAFELSKSSTQFGFDGNIDFGHVRYTPVAPEQIVKDSFQLKFAHSMLKPVDFYELRYQVQLEDGSWEAENGKVISPIEFDGSEYSSSTRLEGALIAELNFSGLSDIEASNYRFVIRIHAQDGSAIDTNQVEIEHKIQSGQGVKTLLLGRLLPIFKGSYSTSSNKEEVRRLFVVVSSDGPEADPRYVDKQTVTLDGDVVPKGFRNSIDLDGVLVRNIIGSRISSNGQFEFNNIDLEEFELPVSLFQNCGTNYTLSVVQVNTDGRSYTTYSVNSDKKLNPYKGPCTEVQIDVNPLYSQQCDVMPSNKMVVRLAVVLDQGRISGEPLKPTTLKYGLPDRLPSERNIHPKIFRLGQVLGVKNLPGYDEYYEFELDTSLMPQGRTELIVELTLDDGSVITQPFHVPVVKEPASFSITYPAEGDRVCAQTFFDSSFPKECIAIDGSCINRGVEVIGSLSGAGPDAEVEFGELGSRVRLLGKSSSKSIPMEAKLRYFESLTNVTRPVKDEDFLALVSRFGCKETGCDYALFDQTPDPKNQTPPGLRSPFEKLNIYTGRIEPKVRAIDNKEVNNAPFIYDYLGFTTQVNGTLGVPLFDTTEDVSLDIRVRNWSGASYCSVRNFSVDAEVEGFDLELNGVLFKDPPKPAGRPDILHQYYIGFSPNNDGHFDALNYELSTDEPVTVEVLVKRYILVDDELIVEPDVFATPISDLALNSGRNVVAWNGKGDGGSTVPDGNYQVTLNVRDGCGNLVQSQSDVQIDTSPPTVVLTYPADSFGLPIVLPISGQIISDDSPSLYKSAREHPVTYELLVNGGDADLKLNQSNTVPYGPLGYWNTFGLGGSWVLSLNAYDALKNKATTTQTIDLPERQNLISSLETLNYFVSPNGDKRLDELRIRIGLLRDVTATVSIKNDGGVIIRTIVEDVELGAGYSTVSWDGRNEMGQLVPDDVYVVELVASNPTNQQVETTRFELDNSSPTVFLDKLNGAVIELSGLDEIEGVISDKNFTGFKFILEPRIIDDKQVDTSIVVLEDSDTERDGLIASIPAFLLEDELVFTAKIQATDAADNQTNIEAELYLDVLPPRLEIETPADQSFFNALSSPRFIATIEERFLRDYSVKILSASDGQELATLLSGSENITEFDVPIDLSMLADGQYILEMVATDRSGLKSKKTLAFVLDNTPPNVSINSPAELDYVTDPTGITGLATDEYFTQYILSIARGGSSAASDFQELTLSKQELDSGQLHYLNPLPEDGEYTLRLTAEDRAGNQSEYFRSFIIDTTPPAPVELISAVFEKSSSDISLEWGESFATDFAGYLVYRNGLKITPDLITGTTFVDESVDEGVYLYHVEVVDLASLNSDPSNQVRVVADLTPPNIRIATPSTGSRINLVKSVYGTAHSEGDFKEYSISLTSSLGTTVLVKRSSVPVLGDELAQLNTLEYEDNAELTLTLKAVDIYDNEASTSIQLFVDNKPPLAPLLDAPMADAINPVNVNLSWTHNDDDGDRLGFLLYRGENLLGANGTVIGDLRPFAIQEHSFVDLDLVDGTHDWLVYAIDEIGNVSEPSNLVELTLDNRQPFAEIVNIENEHEFDEGLYLLAESPDLDIANIAFEYRESSTSDSWQPIVNDMDSPYEALWNTEGVVYGRYDVRAVATDHGGKTDASPAEIVVVKKDVEPPLAIENLAISVTGFVGTLTWDNNTEPDLEGYNVYRAECADCEFVSLGASVDQSSWVERLSSEDKFFYYVTAVDESDNESIKSEIIAGIYTDTTLEFDQRVVGLGSVSADVSVASFAAGMEEVALSVSTVVDPSFELTTVAVDPVAVSAPLAIDIGRIGLNKITARASSDAENFVANESAVQRLVAQGAPSVPADFVGTFDDSSQNLSLSWQAALSSEKVAGYQIFKNGVAQHTNQIISDSTAFASSGSGINNALPSSPANNTWNVNTRESDVTFGQTWVTPRLVSDIELIWRYYYRAASSLEVQALVDGEYVTIAEDVKEYRDSRHTIVLPKPVLTTSLRLKVKQWTSSYTTASLYVFRINADSILSGTSYTENYSSVPNELTPYQIRSVDQYGGLGPLSPMLNVAVGDVEPPQPLLLSLLDGVDPETLTWTESSEAGSLYVLYASGIEVIRQASREYELPNLKNGVYNFTVTAVDQNGNESAHSNEVEVIINNPLLPAPIDLVANYNDGSGEVSLTWQTNSDPSERAFYTVYVASNVEPAFVEVEQVVAEHHDFTDINFVSSLSFYVTATDLSGNESTPSNTVTVAIPLIEYSSNPIITLPFDHDNVVDALEDTTSIIGLAQPGSLLVLFDDAGQQIDTTQARLGGPDSIRSLGPESETYQSLPVGGKTYLLGYNDDYEGVLQVFDGQQITNISELHGLLDGENIDGMLLTTENNILLESYDFGAAVELSYYLYSTVEGTVSSVELPAISEGTIRNIRGFNDREGYIIADVRTDPLTRAESIYRVDLDTGLASFLTISNSGRTFPPAGDDPIVSVSTDATLLLSSVFNGADQQVIHAHDLLTGVKTEFINDTGFEIYEFARWSPDTTQVIALAESEFDESYFVLDLTVNAFTELPYPYDEDSFTWLNNDLVLFQGEHPVTFNSTVNVFEVSSATEHVLADWPEVPDIGLPFARELYMVGWMELGKSLLLGGFDESSVFELPGVFQFNDVALNEGLNTFFTTSISEAGLVSQPSNDVTILKQGAIDFVDLEVELNISKPAVLLGDSASIIYSVKNSGVVFSEANVINILQVAPDGTTIELDRHAVNPIAPGAEVEFSLLWQPTNLGTHVVVVRIDLDDQVTETDENNNIRMLSVDVSETLAPTLLLAVTPHATGGYAFGAGDTIIGRAELFNPGASISGELIVEVMDVSGDLVEQVISAPVSNLSVGEIKNVDFSWSSDGIVPADYQLRARFQAETTSELITQIQAFSLSEELKLVSGLRSNKLTFTDNEQVILTSTISNLSSVASLNNANALLEIKDQAGELVYSQSADVYAIAAGAQIQVPFTWNTTITSAGSYNAYVTITKGVESLSTSSTRFDIMASDRGLVGSITLGATRVTADDLLSLESRIANDGNSVLSGIRIIHEMVLSNRKVELKSDVINELGITENQRFEVNSQLTELADGEYTVRLLAILGNDTRVILDQASFYIQEVTAPMVTLFSPENNGFFRSPGLTAKATAEDASGISRVEYSIDKAQWLVATLSPLNTGVYEVDLSALPEGQHNLRVRAVDNNGNESNLDSRDFTVDNTPPAISLLNIREGQSLMSAVEPVISVRDLNLDDWNVRVNGEQLTKSVSNEGTYRLVIDAADKAGNTSRLERSFEVLKPALLSANDDTLLLRRGVWGTVNVLNNDQIEFIDDAKVSIATEPDNGSLVRVANGTYNYFPSLRYVGRDSFSYQVTSQSSGLSSLATVSVDVAPTASCSEVADNVANAGSKITLNGWARNTADTQSTPKYRIEIVGTSNDAIFAPGGYPSVNFPACDLTYHVTKPNRGRVFVRYKVVDSATGGKRYASQERRFELTINSAGRRNKVVVPFIQLLLGEEE